ncbi:hypothetical protein [Candidatus Proelusimicrobium excrementi]|uniref:hypothetical protein n=1 Tax=Candidatus Proelusimicrobium excrementi TaxID=3416222 RepID=UPI003D0A5356
MKPYSVGLDIGGLTLEVSGNYTPPREACKSGHPDTWEPEEPGELDITAVALDGKALKCDLAAFKAAWEEQIWERL